MRRKIFRVFLAFVALTGSPLAAQQSAGKFSLWEPGPPTRPEWIAAFSATAYAVVESGNLVLYRAADNAKLGSVPSNAVEGTILPFFRGGVVPHRPILFSPDGKTVGFSTLCGDSFSICRVYTASANNNYVPRLIVKPETEIVSDRGRLFVEKLDGNVLPENNGNVLLWIRGLQMAGTTKTNILIEGVFRFDGVLFRAIQTNKFDTILTVVTPYFAVGHDGQMFFGRRTEEQANSKAQLYRGGEMILSTPATVGISGYEWKPRVDAYTKSVYAEPRVLAPVSTWEVGPSQNPPRLVYETGQAPIGAGAQSPIFFGGLSCFVWQKNQVQSGAGYPQNMDGVGCIDPVSGLGLNLLQAGDSVCGETATGFRPWLAVEPTRILVSTTTKTCWVKPTLFTSARTNAGNTVVLEGKNLLNDPFARLLGNGVIWDVTEWCASCGTDGLSRLMARIPVSAEGQTVEFRLEGITSSVNAVRLAIPGPPPPPPPTFTATGVTSAAKSGSGIAINGLASVYGQFLSDVTASAESLPLPTTLGNVSVSLDGNPCPLLYVSPGQVNFQVPTSLGAPAEVRMVITRGGVKSAEVVVTILPQAIALFRWPDGRPLMLDSNFRLVNQAKVGEVAIFLGTGIGLTNPETGQAYHPVEFSFGGVSAIVPYAGQMPGFPGVAQINVVVPQVNGPVSVNVIQGESKDNFPLTVVQ